MQCSAALFSSSTLSIAKVALLTPLAHAGLFLRTKAVSHRSAASSGHRQKIVGGRINMNEEMEKAFSRQGIRKELVEVVFDFPVCVELCDDSRKRIKISNSYLITYTPTPFFNICIKIVMKTRKIKNGGLGIVTVVSICKCVTEILCQGVSAKIKVSFPETRECSATYFLFEMLR